jgi:hypothetical protein
MLPLGNDEAVTFLVALWRATTQTGHRDRVDPRLERQRRLRPGTFRSRRRRRIYTTFWYMMCRCARCLAPQG